VEPIWRDGDQRVSADRAYADVDGQAERLVTYLCELSDAHTLRLTGPPSGNDRLTTSGYGTEASRT
jgi:hypothetical protein